jgi:T5SS/PEP-CTERM-associated repeat protein
MKLSVPGRAASISLAALLMAFPFSAFAGGDGSFSNPYTGTDITNFINKNGSESSPFYYSVSSGDTTGVTTSSEVYVGYSYAYNNLTVNQGASFTATTIYIGVGTTSVSTNGGYNKLTIAGSGSSDTSTILTCTSSLYVGGYGNNNDLSVSSGADVNVSSSFMVGQGFAYNTTWSTNVANGIGYGNTAYIDGAGTTLTCGSMLYVGQYGCSNKLYVTNGAAVSSSIYLTIGVGSTVGSGATGLYNEMYVGADGATADTSSVTAASTWVGGLGSHNRMTVQSGADVVSKGDSGVGQGSSSSTNAENGYGYANRAVVKGAGSSWTVANGSTCYSLNVGNYGSSNSMLVIDGGRVENGVGTIGSSSTSVGNIVAVSGAGSQWINHGALNVGSSAGGQGALIIDGGALVMASSVAYGTSTATTISLTSTAMNGVADLLTTDKTLTSITANTIYFGSGSYLALNGNITSATSTIDTLLSGMMVYDSAGSAWVLGSSATGRSLMTYSYVDGTTVTSSSVSGGTYANLTGYTVFSYGSAVPEPSTYAFFGGLFALGFAMRRRKK